MSSIQKQTNKEASRRVITFAAINKRLQRNIPEATEEWNTRKTYMLWGKKNDYPNYLLKLYDTVGTLQSVIAGSVKYTVGDDVLTQKLGNKMNKTGETARELVVKLAFDYWVFGGFAMQVIRSNVGEVSELYHLPLNFLRWDKKAQIFFYSEDWLDSRTKPDERPKFVPDFTDQKDTVLLVKQAHLGTYPKPVYNAAIKACEIEAGVDDFHLSNIENSFMSSAILHFKNGDPTDEIKDEIEKNVSEKFCGANNAGRPVLIFDDSDSLDIQTLDMPDFADRYNSLASHCQQRIFSAFHANPNLFGIPTENLGFNNEEYEASFKLFNRTMIQPVQMLIIGAFDRIFGEVGSIQIKPFSMDRAIQTLE